MIPLCIVDLEYLKKLEISSLFAFPCVCVILCPTSFLLLRSRDIIHCLISLLLISNIIASHHWWLINKTDRWISSFNIKLSFLILMDSFLLGCSCRHQSMDWPWSLRATSWVEPVIPRTAHKASGSFRTAGEL